LPFGHGKTSPIGAEDVARVVATLLENPLPHLGKVYELTGSQSENMDFYARRKIRVHLGVRSPIKTSLSDGGGMSCSSAAGRLTSLNHLVAMADMHRAGRFDRVSGEVLRPTGQRPRSLQEFVRNSAAAFTAFAISA
jgi:hypothetical protein